MKLLVSSNPAYRGIALVWPRSRDLSQPINDVDAGRQLLLRLLVVCGTQWQSNCSPEQIEGLLARNAKGQVPDDAGHAPAYIEALTKRSRSVSNNTVAASGRAA